VNRWLAGITLLLTAACAPRTEEQVPVATPRSVLEMQLRSRATMPAGPGIPGAEAQRLDGSARLENGARGLETGHSGEPATPWGSSTR
jgi:hypothetical protein